jgi:hypothetical protein
MMKQIDIRMTVDLESPISLILEQIRTRIKSRNVSKNFINIFWRRISNQNVMRPNTWAAKKSWGSPILRRYESTC